MSDKPVSQSEEALTHISEEAVQRQQAESAVAMDDSIQLPISEYEALRQELAEAKKRAETQWDLAVRAKAEVENIRRRAERDLENAHKFSVDKILSDLLPVLDSVEQGLQAIDENDDALHGMREGLVLTTKMFADVLQKFGVQIIEPTGEAFDPMWHEAIAMVENQELSTNTVLQVVQKGYSLHGRVIRAARVVVVK